MENDCFPRTLKFEMYRCLYRVGNGISKYFFAALLVCVFLLPWDQEQTSRLSGG
jgi:formate hydrogenlyase subunit 4